MSSPLVAVVDGLSALVFLGAVSVDAVRAIKAPLPSADSLRDAKAASRGERWVPRELETVGWVVVLFLVASTLRSWGSMDERLTGALLLSVATARLTAVLRGRYVWWVWGCAAGLAVALAVS